MSVSYGNIKTQKSEKGDWEYYSVLYGARNVGCPFYYIIEHSFHTNKKAALWLLEDENLKKLAVAEAKVIADYFGFSKPKKGDVDMNGQIDKDDYLLVKRAVMKRETLSEEQKKLGDMNENGRIDTVDYAILKRKVEKE